MKKNVKFIALVSLFFFLTMNVNAAWKTGDQLTVSDVTSGDNYLGLGCKDCAKDSNGNLINDLRINQYKVGGHTAYCMDVTLNPAESVEVKEVIDASTSAYYTGLAAISKVGYSELKTSGYGISGFEFFGATNLALRIYVIAMGHAENKKSYDEYGKWAYDLTYQYTLANTAATWMNENKLSANSALSAEKNRTINYQDAKSFYESFGLTSSGIGTVHANSGYKSDRVLTAGSSKSIYDAVKKMFFIGLEAAANYNKNIIPTHNLSTVKSLPSNKTTNNGVVTKMDYYTLSVFDFSDTDYISDLNVVECHNCNNMGFSMPRISGYYLKSGGYHSGAPTNEVLKNHLKGNAQIIIEITYSKELDGLDCDDIPSYEIRYTFNSNNVQNNIYILRNDNSKTQRFFAIQVDSNSGDNSQTISNYRTADICDGNMCEYQDPDELYGDDYTEYLADCCTDLNTWCSDSTNPEHDRYCEDYEKHCGGSCKTVIEVPTACTYIDGEGEETNLTDTGYVKSAVQEINGQYKENIKTCLLIRQNDEAGNSYKVLDNSYCKAFCKENFTFDLPEAVKVNSGTYFQLNATISGTKSCYTSEIDVDKFKSDISGLTVNSTEYNQKVNEYNACVNMEVDYSCFDPVIEYRYEEVYNDKIGDNNKFVGSVTIVGKNGGTQPENTYCNSNVDNDYTCTGTAKETPDTFVVNGKTFNYAKYVKSTITKTGNYKTPSVFKQIRPTGEITTENSENAVVIDGLPVAVNTKKGSHKFHLTLKNIGEDYDSTSCKNGVIIGNEDSIYDKQNEAAGKTGKFAAEYQCFYYTNCPECDFGCEGDLCEIEECDGINCTPTCLGYGCVYDGGINYGYRTISLNDLNPNGRNLGYNWDKNKSVKAKETIEKIEEAGENAYDEPEYSITLTPALISAIKAYNKDQISVGGYADNSLTCKDDEFGNKKINCESTFITKLINGDIGNSNNQIIVPEENEKFTSWYNSDYCNGNTAGECSSMGPSWK